MDKTILSYLFCMMPLYLFAPSQTKVKREKTDTRNYVLVYCYHEIVMMPVNELKNHPEIQWFSVSEQWNSYMDAFHYTTLCKDCEVI
jgi:hypothetical protein